MGEKIYCAETQYLVLTGMNGAGLNAGGAVQFTERDMGAGEMGPAGLAPLVVLALVVPSFKIYHRVIVDPRTPVSISAFLHGVWSDASEHGIGQPTILEMREPVAAMDKGFIAWLKEAGVNPIVVPKSSKSHVAFAKSASDIDSFHCNWGPGGATYSATVRSLAAANRALHLYDRFHQQIRSGWDKSMGWLNYRAFVEREKTFCRLAPRSPDCDLSGLALRVTEKPDARSVYHEGEIFHHAPGGLSELIEQWPGGKKRLLEALDIRVKDLRWWLDGRAHLSDRARRELFKLLAVQGDGEDGGDVYYTLGGGYLIHAKNRRAIVQLYDELSHGGDLRLSFELLPPDGTVPPRRVLVFAPWGDWTSIVVFPQEEWVADVLTPDALINFCGQAKAPQALWDHVCVFVEHGAEMQRPGVLGLVLETEHKGWFDELEAKYRY